MTVADYFGFGICALIGGAILWGFVLLLGHNLTSCGEGDAHCVREWISATSGWAAALVAGLSLIYLSKQVRALNIPFIQMRLNDLAKDLAIFGKVADDLHTDREGSYCTQIDRAIDGLFDRQRHPAVTEMEAVRIIGQCNFAFDSAKRQIASCNTSLESPDIREIANKVMNAIEIMTDMLFELSSVIEFSSTNEKFLEERGLDKYTFKDVAIEIEIECAGLFRAAVKEITTARIKFEREVTSSH